MKIQTVTVTGADDSTKLRDLIELTHEFPFVEWGILLSKKNMGRPRYPSAEWLNALSQSLYGGLWSPNLSGHLCGKWVRDLLHGFNNVVAALGDAANMFGRVQLNFHGEPHVADLDAFREALFRWRRDQYIFQADGVNERLMSIASDFVDADPLYDLSGGAGVEPESWPAPSPGHFYVGYAGGLHPNKLGEQLARIEKVAGDHAIWIDVETHVRSSDDKTFDIEKVHRFLGAAREFMNDQENK